MSIEQGAVRLEIAHVLFADIVGYSKLLSDEQRELFALLNDIVRNTSQFRAAEAAGKLVRLSTGDGIGAGLLHHRGCAGPLCAGD